VVLSPLQADLLAWGERRRRDLPWRRTRDPWAVLVSELMLQQTQVARVRGRFEGFLARVGAPAACAAAGTGDVVAAWAGLGYNRRAVELHRAATVVVAAYGGRVPADRAALESLPGVGPYTARAVLAFAFGADVGVLDTNVGRWLARTAGRQLRRPEAQELADGLVPPGRAWEWNQAAIDLGALVCTARAPGCGRCPLAARCAWACGGQRCDDPAVASAGVSRPQSRFEGSDRQGRGRLVATLRAGAVPLAAVPAAAGWPEDPVRARRVADGLVADGLAVESAGELRLP
jgi:A/G-specific adenine glycosylase